MADYDTDRWLARQLAWENALDRLREKAGIELPEEAPPPEKAKRPKRARRDLPTPTKAA